jgi:hypothetical protein
MKSYKKAKKERSPKNSNVRGRAQITRKSYSQNKMSMPRPNNEKGQTKEEWQKKKMKNTKTQTTNSDL